MSEGFTATTSSLSVANVALEIASISRGGSRPPVLFLHGFGSSKEDYADFVRYPQFSGRPFLAYDAPGCGASKCADCTAVAIPFLVETAILMLEQAGFDKFHLAGHSMGGLTGLMLADAMPERVLSFTSIEGNVAPEDCFLSRQIVAFADPDPKKFFDRFIDRAWQAPALASAKYASNLKHKVRAEAVAGIFHSMVELSDHAGLMDRFLGLPCPTMFMYGDENAHLSYLGQLEASGVRLAEIPHCGHFPMYSNPPAMWVALAELWGDD